MRRTALLTLGVTTLLALTAGVAGATTVEWGSSGSGQLFGQGTALTAGPTPEVDAPDSVGVEEAVTGGSVEAAGATRRTMRLRYPGSDYVKVHFSRLNMQAGDSLTVSDPSGAEAERYTPEDLSTADDWAMSVSGDTAVVTVESIRDEADVTVDKVARGMTTAERKTRDDRAAAAAAAAPHTESICGHSDDSADATCYRSSDPVAYAHAQPVARLLIDGVELCTAWRVGPNNRMFTNHHCIASTQDARNTEVWFNYECSVCGGSATLRPTKVWGSQVLATDKTLDYTLFSVQNFGAVKGFGYLTLDVRKPNRGEEVYIPQHPQGDPTVIAMHDSTERDGNCAIANPDYDGYATDTDASYYCDTEGGSSGSPVISRRTNEVIALHHFGGCPNSGVRIEQIYAEVKNLL
jgi:lysyl endopeptidase